MYNEDNWLEADYEDRVGNFYPYPDDSYLSDDYDSYDSYDEEDEDDYSDELDEEDVPEESDDSPIGVAELGETDTSDEEFVLVGIGYYDVDTDSLHFVHV